MVYLHCLHGSHQGFPIGRIDFRDFIVQHSTDHCLVANTGNVLRNEVLIAVLLGQVVDLFVFVNTGATAFTPNVKLVVDHVWGEQLFVDFGLLVFVIHVGVCVHIVWLNIVVLLHDYSGVILDLLLIYFEEDCTGTLVIFIVFQQHSDLS